MKKHIDKMQEMFTLRNIFNFIVMFLASGTIFVAMVYGLVNAGNKEQKMMCLEYQEYAQQFEHFWISVESKVACDKFGIEINAEIH